VVGDRGRRVRGHGEVLRGDDGPLPAEHEEPDFAVFRLPDGDKVEVFGPSYRVHEPFTTGPVAGFLVEDAEETRAEPWRRPGSPL